jgi:hypothetical protein
MMSKTGVEDPVDDAGIHQLPLGVAVRYRGGSTNMAGEPELAEDRIQETTPLGVVALVEIKSDGDMGTDVDDLDDRGGGGRRRIEIGIEGLVRVMGGGSHGCGGCGRWGDWVQEDFAGH